MFGLIVGTLCLCGLFATLRRRHYLRYADYYGYHFGHHHGRGGWHHHAPACGRGFGRGHGHHGRRENPLHFLFAELDTTPGQEKAIILALDALRESKDAVRRDLTGARRELADLFAADTLDAAALDALTQRQQEHFAKFSHMLRDFVGLVHEALNPPQRKTLARLIADGSLASVFRGYAHHEHY